MRKKNRVGVFLGEMGQPVSLLKYSKSACGVDFLLNTADNSEKPGWFNLSKQYKTDFFEFYFFRRAEGYMLLAGKRVELHPTWCWSYRLSSCRNGMSIWISWTIRFLSFKRSL